MSQGSCLGPLFFLLYINDLPHTSNASSVFMYTDDTSLRPRSKDLKAFNAAPNKDLKHLDYCIQGKKVSLNVFTRKSLLVASNQKQKNFLEIGKKLTLGIRGRSIEAVPNIQYLGIYLSTGKNKFN